MSPMETPDDSEPPGDEEVATVILRKIVVIEILLALAFALICYAEMIGLLHSPDTSLPPHVAG
jgi:hypothetical protein